MKKLVLVDLDNLLGFFEGRAEHSGLWLPRFDRTLSRWVWKPDDGTDLGDEPVSQKDTCVVAIAANTVTVRRYGFDLPDLWRFARRVARMLGPIARDAVQMEFALVLPSPQAADRALRQLMVRATNEHGAGCFELLALLSHDRGLRMAIEQALPRSRSPYPVREAHGLLMAFTSLCSLGGGHPRRYAETPSEVGVAAPALPEEGINVLRITTPGACAWAASQVVQRGATLVETVRQVEENPARLTQVALTRSSFRGPARLLAPPDATVGDCASSDGLEWAKEPSMDQRLPVEHLHIASLGAGAVACERPGVTVGTRLPMAWVLRHQARVEAIVGPKVARLDDRGLLASVEPLRPHGWMCHVRLHVRPRAQDRPAALVVDVLPDRSAELPGWWCGHDRRPRSHFEVEGAQGLLLQDNPLETLAQHAVLVVDRHRELILMAPRVEEVTVQRRVVRGTLGACTSGGLPFVVLALDGALPAGTRCSVVPIQDLGVEALMCRGEGMGFTPQTWATLRHVPIVVPVPVEIFVSSTHESMDSRIKNNAYG